MEIVEEGYIRDIKVAKIAVNPYRLEDYTKENEGN